MNEKINIQELIQLLSDRQGVSTQDAETFIKEFFLLIESGLERDKYVKVKGLGTFKLIDVDNRESVDVNTGERIEIQGHTKVSFTPENALKELVNRPFSHFEAVVLNDHVTFDDDSEAGNEETNRREKKDAAEQAAVQPEVKETTEQTGQPEEAGRPEEVNVAEQECPQVKDVVEQAVSTETVATELAQDSIEPHDRHSKATVDERENVASGRQSGSNRLIIGIIAAVVIGCACVTWALYWNSWFPEKTIRPEEKADCIENPQTAWADSTERMITAENTQTEASEQKSQEQPPLQGAEASQQKEAWREKEVLQRKEVQQPKEQPQIQAKENKQPTAQQAQPVKKEKVSSAKTLKADSVNYVIVGTQTSYTVKEGETLTKVALRFYGTKALWPYIVKHNKAVIKNPNNVPYGTVIQIPKLKKKL